MTNRKWATNPLGFAASFITDPRQALKDTFAGVVSHPTGTPAEAFAAPLLTVGGITQSVEGVFTLNPGQVTVGFGMLGLAGSYYHALGRNDRLEGIREERAAPVIDNVTYRQVPVEPAVTRG